jgi:CRP-like cAMP-binding protein
MNAEVTAEGLQSIEFLHGLRPEDLKQIAEVSQIRDFDDGQIIFREDDPAGKLYLIVFGAVSLKICAGTTGSKQIVTLGPGELLGWSSLTAQPRFAATAVVSGPTRVIEIDGRRIRTMCDADAQFGYQFLSRTLLTLSKRLVSTWTQLAELYVPHYAQVSVGAAAQNE